jgi:hypothetical protein
MKTATKKWGFVNIILLILGFTLCVVPPAVCALSYFPLWKASGYASCIAGGGALLLTVCFAPIYKFVSRVMKSYSSYVMWLILFLVFFALSKIADQMTVISLVGFVSNLLGEVCLRIARRGNVTDEE